MRGGHIRHEHLIRRGADCLTNSDLPQLGGETTLETRLRRPEAGSWTGNGRQVSMDAASWADPAAPWPQAGIGWFSVSSHGSVEAEKARTENQLPFWALGARPGVCRDHCSVQSKIDVPVSRRPRIPDEQFCTMPQAHRPAEHLAERGVVLTYHHHMGTIVESQREIDLLMDNTGPAVGLLIDTGHLTYAGADVLEVTRRHARRINHVHCKDVRFDVLKKVRQQDTNFLSAVLAGVYTVPGDGFVDSTSRASSPTRWGWAVVEADRPRRAARIFAHGPHHRPLPSAADTTS
jgi:inosose dehydratase